MMGSCARSLHNTRQHRAHPAGGTQKPACGRRRTSQHHPPRHDRPRTPAGRHPAPAARVAAAAAAPRPSRPPPGASRGAVLRPPHLAPAAAPPTRAHARARHHGHTPGAAAQCLASGRDTGTGCIPVGSAGAGRGSADSALLAKPSSALYSTGPAGLRLATTCRGTPRPSDQ